MAEDDPKNMTDEEKLEKVRTFRAEFVDSPNSYDLFDRKEKSQNYKVNIQWDPDVKLANEEKGKFCLSIPLIKPNIKQVAGTQAQNPRDITVRAEKGTSELSAEIITALVKHAEEKQDARFKKSRWFESGITTGESNTGIFVDKRKGLGGRIRIVDMNDFEVIWDPSNKVYDPSDPEEGAVAVIWEPWVRKDVVEKDYPDKVDEIKDAAGPISGLSGAAGTIGWALGATINWAKNLFRGRNEKDGGFGYYFDDIDDINRRFKYKLTHTWWFERKKCIRWIDVKRGPLEGKILRTDEEIKKARDATKKHQKAFTIEDILCDVMHHTVNLGSLFLEDIVDEFNGFEGYNLIRFIPNFDNGYKTGEVEYMIGTQDEINWLHSMKLNLVKQLANTGWKIARDAVDNFVTWLQDHGSEDGIVIDKSRGGGEVDKIEPSSFPTGIHVSEKDAEENLKTISNVRTEDPSSDKEESGRAILAKQQASQTGSMSIFSNWGNSISMYAHTLVAIIQKGRVYTIDEMKAIIDRDRLLSSEIMDKARGIVVQQLAKAGIELPQPEPLTENADPAQLAFAASQQKHFEKIQGIIDSIAEPIADRLLITELESIETGEYSTKVVTSPYSATNRMANLSEVLALNEALKANGQEPVPRDILIDATDIERKEEIIKRTPQQQQGAAVR